MSDYDTTVLFKAISPQKKKRQFSLRDTVEVVAQIIWPKGSKLGLISQTVNHNKRVTSTSNVTGGGLVILICLLSDFSNKWHTGAQIFWIRTLAVPVEKADLGCSDVLE